MLNAPVPAARKVLAKAGLTIDDIDLFEINEAFSVVAEKFIRDLKLDRDKVNVNGGYHGPRPPDQRFHRSILIGTILDELETARPEARPGDHVRRGWHGMPAIIIERIQLQVFASAGISRRLAIFNIQIGARIESVRGAFSAFDDPFQDAKSLQRRRSLATPNPDRKMAFNC